MRITLVSAHYPPNFVSGGTLQPQRLARGLRDRGHDVRIFAGYLDSERLPLETWDEQDETGLPVHWVVSTPFMGWADPLNYDNPAVADAFAAHLARHPAEVVHLHALQTLGAGLVGVAKASGAHVVVTMHDFWWICARQFLVDLDDRPCSLVVAAGACACQAGRASLAARTARLAELLAPADLVLAPSRSAAEVLAANGVAPGRLAVDENGMSQGDVTPRTGSRDDRGPVVARYTGGSNAMKGADVLVEAAHRLGPDPRLRIIAHGLEEAVERDGRSLEGTPLELAAPYGADELDDVLGASDLLVLPSVARESHSLVTREALLRQVPVVATDTLGPEEVVVDGVNGLIVPAADPELLADALRRATDPQVRSRLEDGARTAPAVRSTEDQLDGLEARYRGLATAAPSPPSPGIERVLFVVGIEGAPLRYRAWLPAEALALHGVATDVRHYRDAEVPDLAARADVVVIYRVPATTQVLALIEATRGAGTPVVFDVDDLIFDPDIESEIAALQLLPPDEAALWLDGVRRYRTTMEACDAYIGSTPRLVEHARDVVGIESHLFENGVGCALGGASDLATSRVRRPGPPRVGYFSGTTTHEGDWGHIEAAVVGAVLAHPEAELWLGGHLNGDEAQLARLGDRLHRLPFVPWTDLPGVLRDLDVNLAPLEPGSRFNDAKSAIKWLEAALVATPTIASPSAPFQDAIESGRSGWLAARPEDWATLLEAALADEAVRRTVGARARRAALLRWSPHLQADRYLAILDAVRRAPGPPRRPSTGWTAVPNDEPWLTHGVALEPYPPGAPAIVATRPPPPPPGPLERARAKASVARDRFDEAGARGVVEGTARWLRRQLHHVRR